MIRKIIEINQEKCNGCGLCAKACREAAIVIRGGKAALLRDDYCDGLGNCLPACPMDAIRFVEREAAPFDEIAVQVHMNQCQAASAGCPGSRAQVMARWESTDQEAPRAASCLRQWPVQLKLVSPAAPYFNGADLLVAADCTAYAYGSFHQDFIDGRITLIGCPKLDEIDYTDKLKEILVHNDVASVTVARMEAPCCGGIERAAREAIRLSGKEIPCRVMIIGIQGRVLTTT